MYVNQGPINLRESNLDQVRRLVTCFAIVWFCYCHSYRISLGKVTLINLCLAPVSFEFKQKDRTN